MQKTIFEKNYESFTTNDGWIVTEHVINPIFVKKELNLLID